MDERWTLEELLSRYELEPSIRDIYVEGPFDQFFLQWFLQQSGLANIVAYPIDSVHLPGAVLDRLGLEHGNRGRVIALAHELEATSPRDLRTQVACVVDADFDHFLKIRLVS